MAAPVVMAGCRSSQPAPKPWLAVPNEHGVALQRDDRHVLLVYRYLNVPFKPYVATLHSPAGVNILRDAPHDHLHHHGLMYAVNVDGVEFWAEPDGAGRQVPGPLVVTKTERDDPWSWTALTQLIDWVGPADKTLLHEKRTIAGYVGRDLEASLLTWHAELSVPAGKGASELVGRHYFGLGMRFLASMDKGGRFFNADGKSGVADTNNVRSAWCAYTAAADGRQVTVALFDHPGNPRHPATWFTMDDAFAYLSLTPDLHHQPITVKEGEPWSYRFGIALWDGEVASDAVASLYQQWCALRPPGR